MENIGFFPACCTALLIFVIVRPVTTTLSRWLAKRSAIRRYGCKEPRRYPHKDPILGWDLFSNMKHAMQEHRFLEAQKELFDTYGPTFKVRSMGRTIIKSADPEVSKAVHAASSKHFGLQPMRYEGPNSFFGNGILVTDGEHWKRGRGLIRPAFDIAHVANFERLGRHVDTCMELLPCDGSTIDLLPILKRVALDISSEFIFGKSMNALSSPEAQQRFMDAFVEVQRGVRTRGALGPRMRWLHRDKSWQKACDYIHSFVDIHVDEALARVEKDEPQVNGGVRLIDEMAKETKDKITLRSLAISVFSPAHDTVAVALCNVFFHLARHPHVWERLRAEIMPTADQMLSYNLLQTYKYLNCVLRESHRVTPIAPATQRQCLKATVLPSGGGHNGRSPLYVHEGDIVETNFRVMLRDKNFWGDDADEFRPDRWETLKPRPTWEFTPFSGGARICPAVNLVYTESAYIVVRFLRRFSALENRDDETDWVEQIRLIFQSKNGAMVGLVE